MVDGGQDRLRRRNGLRFGLSAAAVLLVGGGLYGVTQLGDDEVPGSSVATQPSVPAEAAIPPDWPANEAAVEAGTYRTVVSLAEGGGRIEADFTIDGEGWQGSNYPVAYAAEDFAGFGVYRPESVAGGCQMEEGDTDAASTPQQLVQQLIRMPRSEVVQQPAPTEAFGGDAVHLQLRIDAACKDAYIVAEGPAGLSRGISYFDVRPQGEAGKVIMDFWVVGTVGTPVVVDRFHLEGAPDELIAQSTRAVESVTFVEAE